MDIQTFFSTGFGLVVGLLIIILAVLWLFLPFAIVSIQKRAIELVALNKQILNELQRQRDNERIAKQSTAKKFTAKAENTPNDGTATCPHCYYLNKKGSKQCARCGKDLVTQ